METPPVPDAGMIAADRIFDPSGLAVALSRGCAIAVDDAPGVPGGTRITDADLTCAECGGAMDVPSTSPAKWVAYNVVLNDGLCAACDAD